MARPTAPRLIKKYGNRRLYDTTESRYVTLEELAAGVRGGNDVRVVDAQTGEDLTQHLLAQIILEGRGAAQFLSVPILTQLVRMNDDALADFFGRYVSAALEFYNQTRRSMQSFGPFGPLALPYAAAGAFGRMIAPPPPSYPSPGASDPPPDAPAEDSTAASVEALRRELEDLKRAVSASAAPKKTTRPKTAAKPRR